MIVRQRGGATPRRLLHAYARSDDLRALALHGEVAQILAQLMGSDQVQLSQCHHNCVMTKYPGFSSATLWHQDIRYWSFDRPELISVWYAVGDELADNGALSVIPGTHVENFGRGRLDRNLFLRPELEENQRLIEQAKVVELAAGDALFFHCRLFHAAGRNLTDQVKISPVFTYHAQNNQPIPETSSDRLPSIMLSNAS
ncbi:phytanoyl-CoA dioxygenase family protein [Pseudomonadales bacterium]|nr:phytanoyl-CoA dioxygenase family protein [Pseudomonadales bacterium]